MAKITTGELYAEWQAINSKLQAMIDNGIDTSELQAIKEKLDNIKISNFPNDYPDQAVKTELQNIKIEIQNLKNEQFNVNTSSDKRELYGKDISNRPDADAVDIGTTFTLVNKNLDTWISDGVDWVVV